MTLDNALCYIRNYQGNATLREQVDQRPHKHYSMEFQCILAGSEAIILPNQGRQLRLMPGQIVTIPTEVYHGVQSEGVERLCFSFAVDKPDNSNSVLTALFSSCQEVLLFENMHTMQLVEQCHRLQQNEDSPLSSDRQGILLLGALLELLSNTTTARKPTEQESSRAIQQKWLMEDYIERHLTDNTGLEGLAKELYLSQRQTRTLVRRFFGEDYKQLIIRRRMALADIFLQDLNKSLDEIAWLVGYRSCSGFQLCFKKYFGITPQEKRKALLTARQEQQ